MTDKLEPLDLSRLPKGKEEVTFKALAARALREATEQFVDEHTKLLDAIAGEDPRLAAVISGPQPVAPHHRCTSVPTLKKPAGPK